MKENMVAFCGMTCSECRTFIATWRNDGELREEVAKSWSTETETLKPEDMNCAG
ncbi:DUF3795 domain-containing protein, partial [Candidatus Micrarchaeota archaeon]|nr:DUF3795 domain-containing protein [Candidatus Micrarchaeota archaeon]